MNRIDELKQIIADAEKEIEKLKKANPFKRVEKGEIYYCITGADNIVCEKEYKSAYDDVGYNHANYFNDKDFAMQVILYQLLNRMLMRFAYEKENAVNEEDWKDNNIKKYYIAYNYDSGEYEIYANCSVKNQGIIYFKTREIAEQAIEKVVKPFMAEHKEFVLMS